MSYDDEITEGETPRKAKALIELPEGMEWFKPTEEKLYKIDIIPFRNKKGELQQWQYFDVHKGIGPNKRSVLCQKAFNKKCPVCDAQQEVLQGSTYQDANTATKELFKSFYPKNRVMANVMVEGKLMVFESSTFKFSDPLKRAAKSYQESEAIEKFSYASPERGYTVTLQTAKKDNPFKPGEAFFDIESVGFRERKKQYSKDIIEDAVDLSALLEPTENSVIEGMLYGGPAQEDDSVMEDEPAVETVKPKAKAPVNEDIVEDKPLATAPATVVPTVKCIGGGTFGKDYDKFKACDDCGEFSACRKKNRQLGEDAL